MSEEKAHNILLVAGDYEVVEQVQNALLSNRYNVQNAYNHRDALYLIGQEKFELLIVDDAMTSRHDGDKTVRILAENRSDIKIIACVPGSTPITSNNHPPNVIITRLGAGEIQSAVTRALNEEDDRYKTLPTIQRDPLVRQMDEIRTLFELSRSLTAVLDLTEVLNRVVKAARDLTNAEEGMILMPEEDELYMRARVGIDSDTARNFRIKTRDTLAGQVFRSGQPKLIGSSGPQKLKTQYFVNSLLYVPIFAQGETIGVLGVNNKTKEDEFTLHHQDLLQNLASFAAIAIENARVHQESIERTRELETLVAASKVLNASLSLEETLPNICEQLANVLKVGYTEILTWDEPTEQLNTLARFHGAAWRFSLGPSIDLSQHIAMSMALQEERHKSVGLQDREYAAEVAHLKSVGAQRLLIVPVNVSKGISAVIRAYYVSTPERMPQLDIIQRVHRITFENMIELMNSTNRFATDKHLQMVKYINESCESDWVEIIVLMAGSTEGNVLLRGGYGAWLKETQPVIKLANYRDMERILDRKETIVVQESDPNISNSGQLMLDLTQGRSVLGIPLIQRGKTRGLVIFADTIQNRTFSTREIDLARAIVGQSATALENASLVHDLEKSVQDLRDTQERLVKTARLSAMGEMASVVAHQINNPLTTIIVDTEMMLMDEPKESPNYKSLQAISRAGNRAASVARRLLAITRSSEDPESPVDLIDIVDTVQGILSLVQTHIERNNIRIKTHFPEERLPGVMAIKGRLDDVWLNLLMNANDALLTIEGRERVIDVDISHDEQEDKIVVTVTDNGHGMSPDIQQQIFNPFFTTKPAGEGTGLGLHVSKEEVENIGGTIEVESTPDEQTRFIVRLPVANL